MTALVWLVALLVTVILASFQRMTGPTYPLEGTVQVGGQPVSYELLRSHGGSGGLPVLIPDPDARLHGEVLWRRFPTNERWHEIELARRDGKLVGEVPHQPPAGKVEYRVAVWSAADTEPVLMPAAEAAVARFKGAVPAGVLVPHILAMFLSMLVFTAAVAEVWRHDQGRAAALVWIGLLLLVVGGLVLGPVVQQFAFGKLWTGWPFGGDWTDNKTLVAVIAWLPAAVLLRRRQSVRLAVTLGWVVMMGVFLIPHSSHGSQLDWSELETQAPVASGGNDATSTPQR